MTLESPGRALHRCCCQTSSPVYSPYLEGRDMLRKKKSLLYILDSSLPRKQPWPGTAGQPPSLEETDNKKGVLRRNESAILHALTAPLIKIYSQNMEVCYIFGTVIFQQRGITTAQIWLKTKPGARECLT